LGCKMIYSDNAMPTVDTSHPLIKSPADLDKLGPLDPSKGRVPMEIEMGRLAANAGFSLFAGGIFTSPFSFLCQAMGYPKVVRALRRDRVFAQELFDYAENEVIFPLLIAQAKVGIKSAIGPDAWACFPNLTLDMLEEWVLPSALRLKERAKKELKMTISAGIGAADYCEEDPTKFDRDIMWKCFDMASKIAGQQTAMLGMGPNQYWDPQWVQDYALDRGNTTIMAGMNARFIRDSSPQEIVAKIRQWIDILGREGSFIMLISNTPADTPPLHLHTVMQAIKVLGRYPIADDLNSIVVEPPRFQSFDQWLKGQPEEETILKARE